MMMALVYWDGDLLRAFWLDGMAHHGPGVWRGQDRCTLSSWGYFQDVNMRTYREACCVLVLRYALGVSML